MFSQAKRCWQIEAQFPEVIVQSTDNDQIHKIRDHLTFSGRHYDQATMSVMRRTIKVK